MNEPQLQQQTILRNAKDAETDLLGKLHINSPALTNARNAEAGLLEKLKVNSSSAPRVTAPPTGQTQMRALTTRTAEAEKHLLTALAVKTQPVTLSMTNSSASKIDTAKAAEDALIGNLQQSPNTITTIIPGNKTGGSSTTPNPAPNTAVAISPQTTITTIIPGNNTSATMPGIKPDTTVAGPLIFQPPASTTYTFVPTANAVQVSQNGKIIATTTPQLATEQYGYHLPNPPILGSPATAATVGTPATLATPTTIGKPVPLGDALAAANQASNSGTNLSFNASTTPVVAQAGNVKASLSFANISGSLTEGAGVLPLSQTIGVNGAASAVQARLSDPSAGLTVSGSALSLQGSASASVSPFGATLSANAGAYLVQGQVDKQITVANYDVNLGIDGGLGVSIGGSQSIGFGGTAAGNYNFGPVGLFYSIGPD